MNRQVHWTKAREVAMGECEEEKENKRASLQTEEKREQAWLGTKRMLNKGKNLTAQKWRCLQGKKSQAPFR